MPQALDFLVLDVINYRCPRAGVNLDNRRGETWDAKTPRGASRGVMPPGKEELQLPQQQQRSKPPYNSQLLAVLVVLASLLVVLGIPLESTHAAAVLVAALGVARLLLARR
jgi:hypothetical protein